MTERPRRAPGASGVSDLAGGDPCPGQECNGRLLIKQRSDPRLADPRHVVEELVCSTCGQHPS